MGPASFSEFDLDALYDALEAKRTERGLSWPQVADALWAQSSVLNARRNDHPISPATLRGMARRGMATCQHVLFILRWLDRTPESFLSGNHPPIGRPLPAAGPDRRLRWDLPALYEAVDARRRAEALTWSELAVVIGCTPSQLTGIRTARFAIGIHLAMRLVQWLGRPASEFVYAAHW